VFWKLLRGVRVTLAVSLVAATVASALRLVSPAAMGFAIDHALGGRQTPDALTRLGVPGSPRDLLAVVAIALLAVMVLSTAIGTAGRYLLALANRRLQSGLRRRVFAHVSRLPIHRVRAYQSGGLASVLRDDVNGAADLLNSMVYQTSRSLIQLLGTAVALGWIEWRALAVIVVFAPTVLLLHRRWILRIRPMWRETRLLRRRMDAHATEVFAGIRMIRSFGRQRTEAIRDARDQHLNLRLQMLTWWMSTAIDIAWSLLAPGVLAIVLWYGGNRILADTAAVSAGALDPAKAFTVGRLVTLIFYLGMLIEPMGALASAAGSSQNGLAALDRVLDVLRVDPEPRCGPSIHREVQVWLTDDAE